MEAHPKELFYGVHFPSASKGYAVGAGGMIKAKTWRYYCRNSSLNSNDMNLSVFPNPASDLLFIQLQNIKITNVKIYNSLGVEITKNLTITEFGNNELSVDTSVLSKGIYFIRVNEMAQKVNIQ